MLFRPSLLISESLLTRWSNDSESVRFVSLAFNSNNVVYSKRHSAFAPSVDDVTACCCLVWYTRPVFVRYATYISQRDACGSIRYRAAASANCIIGVAVVWLSPTRGVWFLKRNPAICRVVNHPGRERPSQHGERNCLNRVHESWEKPPREPFHSLIYSTTS